MNTNAVRCAVLSAIASALLAGCGTEEPDGGSGTTAAEDNVMAQAMDGSAARAVGDMMSDPSIRDQLGMPSAPPPNAGSSRPTGASSDTMTIIDPSPAQDPSQVRALALCRGMKSATDGMPRPIGQEADAAAADELRRDPEALVRCQAQ